VAHLREHGACDVASNEAGPRPDKPFAPTPDHALTRPEHAPQPSVASPG
jgi:hypothetical protein